MVVGICYLSPDKAGETSDLIEHGKSGHVVDFGKTKEAAILINTILENKERREILAYNASERIMRNFNFYITVDEFLHCLNIR